MFSHSVISKTQQMWKLWVGVVAMVFGSVAPAFDQADLSWTAGTLIAVAGYVFTLALIRCPVCGQRWLWKATLDAGLYGPLFRKSRCPSCGHEFG